MAANYTGDPTQTQAPAAKPTPGVALVVSIPGVGDGGDITSITQDMKACADYITFLMQGSGSAGYGDGSDGPAVFDGANTFAFAGKASNVYTLNRDVFLSALSMTSGSILITNGWRIYVNGLLQTVAGSVITAPGNNAGPGATPGNPTFTGSLPGGQSGGGGSIGSTGGSGPGAATGLGGGGLGGAGGLGSGGAGGPAGTDSLGLIAAAPTYGSPRAYPTVPLGSVSGLGGVQYLLGGTGGGGAGGGAAAQPGGGGGGGGGVIAISARSVILGAGSDLFAPGGAGAAATGVNAGGGGGGAGGFIQLAFGKLTILSGTMSANVNCPGGNAGGKNGTGVAGTSGGIGSLVQIQIA